MSLPFTRMSFPEMYEQALVEPLFRPWAEIALDDLDVAAGDRVLDVACGTGIAARLARARVGDAGVVVGVDLAPSMLAVARRVAPDLDWRQGDAAALPLRDAEQFDAVVCLQGLQFFPDRAAAVREMRRALAPGGRLALGTWRPDDELPFLRELRRIAERHVGAVDDRRHGFGDAGPIEALLRDAGFGDVRSRTVTRTIRFEDPEIWLRLNAMALVGMSAGGREMADADRQRLAGAIVADSAEAARAQTGAGGLAFEIASNIVTARG